MLQCGLLLALGSYNTILFVTNDVPIQRNAEFDLQFHSGFFNPRELYLKILVLFG